MNAKNIIAVKEFLSLYLLEILENAENTKYLNDEYIDYEDEREVYMTEEEGKNHFERLYKAFKVFIGNKDLFDLEKYDEVKEEYIPALIDYAQAVLDKKNHIYAAFYYFEYDGIKYAIDIKAISDSNNSTGNFICCNVVEFCDSYNYLDKRVELVFVYDIENNKFIELLGVIENVCQDEVLKISKVLDETALEKTNKRMLGVIK